MTDGEIMTKALDAEEAFNARVRLFKIHKSAYSGVVIRVVEHPTDPEAMPDFSAPIVTDAVVKYWDFGDEQMAKDFIRLQGWKAAVKCIAGIN